MPSIAKSKVEVWGGMECTLNRVNDEFFDQLDFSGHRERAKDIDLFASLGLIKMRYPVLWERHQPREHEAINWEQTEKSLHRLREKDIAVIAGLVHHGSGPSYVHIMDSTFASGLAVYAYEVASRFPWIDYYTPINEPLTTARFCGLYGIWFPHRSDDAAFCRILVNECKATVMAMAVIRIFNPQAKLVQTEDMGKTHSTPALCYQADFENERRWLSFDLLCGKVDPGHALWSYLVDHGIETFELEYFLAHPCPPDIIGINHYLTSERYLDEGIEDYPVHAHGGNGRHTYADVEAVRVSGVVPDGLQALLYSVWKRYYLPIAITEVHLNCTREEQMRWLQEVWLMANHLRDEGIPVLAITAWALLGSFGWDKLLSCPPGNYQSGVFSLNGGIPQATVLADMIRAFSCDGFFEHSALSSPGWWRRNSRISYGGNSNVPACKTAGKPLVISGRCGLELNQICENRSLNAVYDQDYANCLKAGPDIWARVMIDDDMHFCQAGRPDLVIRLPGAGDMPAALSASLDLFLDGACGAWFFEQNGILVQCSDVMASYEPSLTVQYE